MNDDDLFPFQKLDIYRVTLALAARVVAAKIRDTELREQATRAAKSTHLNIAEGLPSDATGTRQRHFAIANGSLHETVAAVDLARVIGAVDTADAAEIQRLACAARRILGGLRR